jgi:hypothetical protein
MRGPTLEETLRMQMQREFYWYLYYGCEIRSYL